MPTTAERFLPFLAFLPSRQPSSTIAPLPAWPLRRCLRLRPCLEMSRPSEPGVAVAPGVGVPTTVSTGEGKGVGCDAGVPNGVEDTVGVAVCVGEEVGVEVGVPAEAVGVGSPWIAVAAGLGVLVADAVSVGVGSCAIAAPPSTAAYSAAQLRARRRIFLGERLTGGSSHARGPHAGGSDSAQLRHCAACA